MSFGFLDVIFWGKRLEIDTYKYVANSVSKIQQVKMQLQMQIFAFALVVFLIQNLQHIQATKLHLVISHTYGQHLLIKVAQRAKIDVLKQF
eukprot:UN25871